MEQQIKPELQELDQESTEQQIKPELQELDNDDLQNVSGGLSQGAQDGIIAGGVSVGVIFGGGALWHHLEQRNNKSLYGDAERVIVR